MPNHIIHDTLYALNLYYQFLLTKTTQSGPEMLVELNTAAGLSVWDKIFPPSVGR